MKIYIACYDGDQTLRSSALPEKAFLSKEKATEWLVKTYKEDPAKIGHYTSFCMIYEIELESENE